MQPVAAKIISVVIKSPEISEEPAKVEVKMEGSLAAVEIRKKRTGRICSSPAAQVSRSLGVPGIKNNRKEISSKRFSS